MRREFFLWKLYHLQLDYKEAEEGRAARAAAAEELRREHQADLDKAGGSGAEVAACKKERNSAVRALDELRRKRDEQVRRRGGAMRRPTAQRVEQIKTRGACAESAAAASARGARATESRAGKDEEERGRARRQGRRRGRRARGHRGGHCQAREGARQGRGGPKQRCACHECCVHRHPRTRTTPDTPPCCAAGDLELTAEQQEEYRELKLRADSETVGDLAALAQARGALDALEPSAAAAEEQLVEMRAQLDVLDADVAEVRAHGHCGMLRTGQDGSCVT